MILVIVSALLAVAVIPQSALGVDAPVVLAVAGDGRQAILRTDAVIRSCPHTATPGAVATGAARWSNDRAVIVYTAVDGDGQVSSDIELLSGPCAVEAVSRFPGRQMSGVAVGPQNELWVSDLWAGELLEIDPRRGSIPRSVPLPVAGSLRAIDSGGRFYIANSAGVWILKPDGAIIRGAGLPAVDGLDLVDRAEMWVLSGANVFHLSAGTQLGWFVLSSAGNAILWDDDRERLWVGTLNSAGAASVLQVSADGTRLGEVAIPQFHGEAPAALALVPWRTSTGSGGDGCQVEPTSKAGSRWLWIGVAGPIAYALWGVPPFAVARRARRRRRSAKS